MPEIIINAATTTAIKINTSGKIIFILGFFSKNALNAFFFPPFWTTCP